MTEDQAKKKWCPFTRVMAQIGDRIESSGNRVIRLEPNTGRLIKSGTPDGSYCIASACMAWRETGFNSGFCALAGSPE